MRIGTTEVEIDLHGYHPDDICGKTLSKIIQHAFKAGAKSIRFIHGHGRNRGILPGFVNTNTGYFGLRIRDNLRHDVTLRQWIKYTTLDCSHNGSTVVALKRNPTPTRTKVDFNSVLPEKTYVIDRDVFVRRRRFGSFAILKAIRQASSFVSRFVTLRLDGSSSK